MVWHIDNIKISHMNKDRVKSIITKLEERFDKIIINFCSVYDFIGMNMKFLINKISEVDIRSYLKEAVEDFIEEDLRRTKTPVKLNLFDIDANSPLVSKKDRIKFHSIVMKLMHVSYRGWKDM